MSSSEEGPSTAGVDGIDSMDVTQSAVHRRGQLRCRPIDGLQLRPTRPGPHDDGVLVVRDPVSIVVYGGRQDCATSGSVNEFRVSERNPGLVLIPPMLCHGQRVIGTDEAFITNMPTLMYQFDEPDAFDLPYESEQAESVVPGRW